MHTRRAVCAGPDGNGIVLCQCVCDYGRLLVPDIERHDWRTHRTRKIAVDVHAVHIPYTLIEPAGQREFVRADCVHARLPDEFHGGKQTRDAVTVARSGFEPCRVLRRLRWQKRLYTCPADAPRADVHAPRDAKATRALRAHEALVARKAQNADVLRAHIDGEHARRLRRIDDKQQSVRRAERANARQIKQVPRQI